MIVRFFNSRDFWITGTPKLGSSTNKEVKPDKNFTLYSNWIFTEFKKKYDIDAPIYLILNVVKYVHNCHLLIITRRLLITKIYWCARVVCQRITINEFAMLHTHLIRVFCQCKLVYS